MLDALRGASAAQWGLATHKCADMVNTAAYGKAVVKYIQAVKCFQCFCDLDVWSCGHCSYAYAYFTCCLKVDLCCEFVFLFVGFRVPQPFASVSQLPAALRIPQKTRS